MNAKCKRNRSKACEPREQRKKRTKDRTWNTALLFSICPSANFTFLHWKNIFYRFLPTIKISMYKLKMKSEMDIVEIVTTIAHKIWNCKHFSSFQRHWQRQNKENRNRKRKRVNEAKSDFISISYAPILFYFFFVFFPLFFLTNCANVDAFIWIFAFAFEINGKSERVKAQEHPR